MPRFDLVVESPIVRSTRTKQLEAMFDVPPQEIQRIEWNVDLPIDQDDWQVGLVVGPSGCGKSQIARRMWGDSVDTELRWGDVATIDDFDRTLSMEQITEACMAVGFNTIPSWMRPHRVLSNGERFRVELARRLLEGGDTVVVDEFTSVVDRQVAQIASHAVQKHIRRGNKRFVAVTCHYDVIEWLRPDWMYDPSTQKFARGCLRQRPSIPITISPVPYSAWSIFAPFHYMTADLHRASRCFGLFVGDRLAAFAGMLHRAGKHKEPIMGCSRLVTLPDFQGLGLAFVLIDKISSIYKAIGKRVHTYPAHPSLIRGFDKSSVWSMQKKPGVFSMVSKSGFKAGEHKQGGRPCAVFRYEGPAAEKSEAERVLAYWGKVAA
jgi:energy-coupling factor transporter ATP-binding protein EcfA2/GNAT superfamily N-acetyltransferase